MSRLQEMDSLQTSGRQFNKIDATTTGKLILESFFSLLAEIVLMSRRQVSLVPALPKTTPSGLPQEGMVLKSSFTTVTLRGHEKKNRHRHCGNND